MTKLQSSVYLKNVLQKTPLHSFSSQYDKVDDTPRVLITSFAPFNSNKCNISSYLSDALMGNVQGDGFDLQGANFIDAMKEIRKKKFLIRSLKLQVLWDLPGIYIVENIKSFQPDVVLMLGQGRWRYKIIFENGCLNQTCKRPGHSSEGKSLKNENISMGGNIANGPKSLTHSWQAQDLIKRLGPIAKKISPHLLLFAPMNYSETNNYICNNSAYIVENALRGNDQFLANHLISLKSVQMRNISSGFLHLPNDRSLKNHQSFQYKHQLKYWIHFLEDLIFYVEQETKRPTLASLEGELQRSYS